MICAGACITVVQPCGAISVPPASRTLGWQPAASPALSTTMFASAGLFLTEPQPRDAATQTMAPRMALSYPAPRRRGIAHPYPVAFTRNVCDNRRGDDRISRRDRLGWRGPCVSRGRCRHRDADADRPRPGVIGAPVDVLHAPLRRTPPRRVVGVPRPRRPARAP